MESHDHCCFCNNDSTHFSQELASTHSTIAIRGLSIHLFSFINEIGFYCLEEKFHIYARPCIILYIFMFRHVIKKSFFKRYSIFPPKVKGNQRKTFHTNFRLSTYFVKQICMHVCWRVFPHYY